MTLALVDVTGDCVSVVWDAHFGMGYSDVHCVNSGCVPDLEPRKEAVEAGPTFDLLPSD